MRTLVRLELRSQDAGPISTTNATTEIAARIRGSIWYPEEQLSDVHLQRLLEHARDRGGSSEGLRHAEAADIVEADQTLPHDPQERLLATNVLVLLTQIRDGIPLAELRAESIVPLHDGASGCWGIATVRRNQVNVRVRSESIERLEAATERALVALNVVADNARALQRAFASESVALVPTSDDVLEVTRDGTTNRVGRVHVLGRFGRARYSLAQPAPLWLMAISLVLLVASFGMQALQSAGATDGWLEWGHSLLDKILTTAFWTTALVVVQAFRALGRHPQLSQPGRRIYIAWKRP